MKRIFNLFYFLVSFVLCFGMSMQTLGQQVVGESEFDSIYQKGFSRLNSNIVVSVECLKKLESLHSQLSPVQRAKTNFLRLKVISSNVEEAKALENKLFAAPDSLGQQDALVFSARKLLEKSMPDKAIPLLMDALDTIEKGSDKADFCIINLCEAYREKQEYSKGIEMLKDILMNKKAVSDENRAFAYNRMAALYNEWGFPKASYNDSVDKYSELCIALSEKINSQSNLGLSQNELSYQYLGKKQYAKALGLSKKAVTNFKESGMVFSAMNALINQSNIYKGLKEYDLSQKAVVEATELCQIEENRNLFMRLYLQLSNISYSNEKYKDACDFLTISRELQLDFFRDRINVQINEQSARFDLLMKEQKIGEEKQKNEFRRKQILFLIVTMSVLCIAFVASFFYFRIKRKESIKQQLIEAVVETEAIERKRIARDLHDGLGPVLSAINLYFQAYLDARDTEKEQIRDKMQTVISGAIDEVSRISHNISPHILENHGLITALNNFIAPLVNSGKLDVEFTSDFCGRVELNKELSVYRCITELLNNTMKHARASKISIDIRSKGKVLYVSYADNGMGFETSHRQPKGMGLSNIKNRVETFGGKLLIESSPKKGIKVNIEIPI